MYIHVSRAGQNLGTFGVEEFGEQFRTGAIVESDDAMVDGDPQWSDAGAILRRPDVAALLTGAAPPPDPIRANAPTLGAPVARMGTHVAPPSTPLGSETESKFYRLRGIAGFTPLLLLGAYALPWIGAEGIAVTGFQAIPKLNLLGMALVVLPPILMAYYAFMAARMDGTGGRQVLLSGLLTLFGLAVVYFMLILQISLYRQLLGEDVIRLMGGHQFAMAVVFCGGAFAFLPEDPRDGASHWAIPGIFFALALYMGWRGYAVMNGLAESYEPRWLKVQYR